MESFKDRTKSSASVARVRSAVVEALEGRQFLSASAAPVVTNVAVGHGLTIQAAEGKSFSGEIATFAKLPIGKADLKNTFASIDWGDGDVSTGTITQDAKGVYDVFASHTYAEPGEFKISTTLARSPAHTGPITDPLLILVGQAAGHADVKGDSVGLTIHPIAKHVYSGPVAVLNFVVPVNIFPLTTNIVFKETYYTATINWGDGKTTTGTFDLNAGGTSSVFGDHTYAKPGDFKIHVTVIATQRTVGPIGPVGPVQPLASVVVGPTPISTVTIVASPDGEAIVSKA